VDENPQYLYYFPGQWFLARRQLDFHCLGFLNALYILPSILFNTHRRHLDIVAKGQLLPTLNELLAMGLTFSLTVLAWIFFRSVSVTMPLVIFHPFFSHSLFTQPDFPG
jgi:D-alanyl-lipoteichoic acid acyltransferase DltB (MBOAT superfamily)